MSALVFQTVSCLHVYPWKPSLLSPIRATCPAHPLLLDLIARRVYGEQSISWSSSLWCTISSIFPLTPINLWLKYLPQHPTLEHLQPMHFPLFGRPKRHAEARFILHASGKQMEWQRTMDRLVARSRLSKFQTVVVVVVAVRRVCLGSWWSEGGFSRRI